MKDEDVCTDGGTTEYGGVTGQSDSHQGSEDAAIKSYAGSDEEMRDLNREKDERQTIDDANKD